MMDEPLSRSTVEAFYAAYASRDPIRVAPFLADDVEWHLAGPVDLIPFCGYRRGREAVIDYLARGVPSVFAGMRFELDDLVIEGSRAGLFSKVSAVQKTSGRVIHYRCAHFITFRAGKVVSLQGLSDTFDMVEQVVGHRIDAYHDAQSTMPTDLVTV
jgi:ketosteroid isomerase-like protein